MRMQDPDSRLNGNVLSMRISRMMDDYTIIFTWRGTCDWNHPTKDQERRLTRLDNEAIEHNSTRRFTPGLMYPELGEAGGRIPLPDLGRKRSQQSYRHKPVKPRAARVSRPVPSRGSKAPKKRKAPGQATALIPAYLLKEPKAKVTKRRFRTPRATRERNEDVGLGHEIRKATEAAKLARAQDEEVDVGQDEDVSPQDEDISLGQNEDVNPSQDEDMTVGHQEYVIPSQDQNMSHRQKAYVVIGQSRYMVGRDGYVDLSQDEYLPLGDEEYLPLGQFGDQYDGKGDDKYDGKDDDMDLGHEDLDDSSYTEDGPAEYETDATEESPIRPQKVTAASRTAYLARLSFVPRSRAGTNDAFTVGQNAAALLELSDEDAPYEEATELDWALDTYWYRYD